MLRTILKVILLLVLFIGFIPKDGLCDDCDSQATSSQDHHCSLACPSCFNIAIDPAFQPTFQAFAPVVSIVSGYSYLYTNPTPDGFKRPPISLS